VVFEALGDWRAKERVEWEERELVLLLNQKRGGEGVCTGRCCGGEVADGRAAGRRGGEGSRRWRRGGAGAAVSGADGRR
jgi:hypothetical protein